MKNFIIAAPLAVLLGSVAFAQDAATGSDSSNGVSGSGVYGESWSQSIGTTFYTDADRTTLRSGEELTQGWSTLSQEDRDVVLAECERYTTETASSGDSGEGIPATDGASTGAVSADAGTDTNSTTPMTDSSGDAGAGVMPTEGAETGAVSADAGTDTNSTTPITDSSGDAGAGVTATEDTSSGTDSAMAETVGYDATAMATLCPAVQGL